MSPSSMRLLVVVAALWMSVVPAAALADNSTPPPQVVVTPPPAVEPTVAPVEQPTLPAPEPTQPPQPAQVTREQPGNQTSGSGQVVTEPTAAPTAVQSQDTPGSTQSSASPPAGISPRAAGQQIGNGAQAPLGTPKQSGPAPSSGVEAGAAPPTLSDPGLPSDASISSGISLPDVNATNASAAAPAQLTCHGKSRPVSDPFLVSPFAGWTTVNSFLDHDSPDYGLDGKIVLANGVGADASAGQASDFFPSYWSPALRQYVSYDGHNGYDFGISYVPVLAAADGTVSFADWNGPSTSSGYGQMVLIDHHNGYVTLYGHLSKLDVHQGERVLAGQEIGISGSTGNSSGPHLHFSVFHNCQVTDPYGWTGSGTDPLTSFDGEHAGYLWLPGHDPLVLNPPPHWPTFPLGLHLSLPGLKQLHRLGRRYVPPIDRLMLLALPTSRVGRMSAGAAIALAEAQINQEAETVLPYLQDLKAQGLIDTYQVVPAAAAVWVRGTATSGELEGLPGVASLSGVQPRDLLAAQAGLGHSVLMQISGGAAPSLWPVGFRSSLTTWRTQTTVSQGHSLVAGYTLPGREVVLSLLHSGRAVAYASTIADPQSGGYVAMLHNGSGQAVPVASGDRIDVASGHRTSSVIVVPSGLRARTARIVGGAPANCTVAVTVAGDTGPVLWHGLVKSAPDGAFTVHVARHLEAGTQVVASFVDSAGDDESVASQVPGLVVTQGSPVLHGWAAGKDPVLTLSRHGRVLFQSRLTPSPDGSYRLEVTAHGQPVPVRSGDQITVGSRWHHRTLTVEPLHVIMRDHNESIRLRGVSGARVVIQAGTVAGASLLTSLSLSRQGGAVVRLPGSATANLAAAARYVFPQGDIEVAQATAGSVQVNETADTVQGQTVQGATVSVRMLDRAGRPVAGGIATASDRDGSYAVRLRLPHPVGLHDAARLVIRDAGSVREISLPRATLTRVGGQVQAAGSGGRVRVEELDARGREVKPALRSVPSGHIVTLPMPPAGGRLVVSVTGHGGVTVTRALRSPIVHVGKARNTR